MTSFHAIAIDRTSGTCIRFASRVARSTAQFPSTIEVINCDLETLFPANSIKAYWINEQRISRTTHRVSMLLYVQVPANWNAKCDFATISCEYVFFCNVLFLTCQKDSFLNSTYLNTLAFSIYCQKVWRQFFFN